MTKISISNIGVVHGLFIDYSVDGCSDSLVFGDISNSEESLHKLISLLKRYNDVNLDSLNEIIEDFVCEQGISSTECTARSHSRINTNINKAVNQ